MKTRTLNILVFSSEKISREISDQLRKSSPEILWQIVFAQDPQTALEKFRLSSPPLVLLGQELPETSPVAFARELLRHSSETSIFCFYESADVEIAAHELEPLPWPVVSWAQVIDQLLSGLPNDLQERLGGRKLISPLRAKLSEYSTAYLRQHEMTSSPQKFVWIPQHRTEPGPAQETKIKIKNDSPLHLPDILTSKKTEWLILAGTLGFALASWAYHPDEEMIFLSGVRVLSTVISGAAFLGYFATRAIIKAK